MVYSMTCQNTWYVKSSRRLHQVRDYVKSRQGWCQLRIMTWQVKSRIISSHRSHRVKGYVKSSQDFVRSQVTSSQGLCQVTSKVMSSQGLYQVTGHVKSGLCQVTGHFPLKKWIEFLYMYDQKLALVISAAVATHCIDARQLLREMHHESNKQLLSVDSGTDLWRNTESFYFIWTISSFLPVILGMKGLQLQTETHQRQNKNPGLPVRLLFFPAHFLQVWSSVIGPSETMQSCDID